MKREEFEAKLAEEMEKVLEALDDKIAKMYGTIDEKLKHVSKSVDAKFENYSSFLTESQATIAEQMAKFG